MILYKRYNDEQLIVLIKFGTNKYASLQLFLMILYRYNDERFVDINFAGTIRTPFLRIYMILNSMINNISTPCLHFGVSFTGIMTNSVLRMLILNYLRCTFSVFFYTVLIFIDDPFVVKMTNNVVRSLVFRAVLQSELITWWETTPRPYTHIIFPYMILYRYDDHEQFIEIINFEGT